MAAGQFRIFSIAPGTSSSGSLAIFAAIRRASSLVSSLAASSRGALAAIPLGRPQATQALREVAPTAGFAGPIVYPNTKRVQVSHKECGAASGVSQRSTNASPLSTIGRKRMAKTLASLPPHNNLEYKARLHGSHCHQPHDKHQPSIEPHRSNWLLDRVGPLRNRGNP